MQALAAFTTKRIGSFKARDVQVRAYGGGRDSSRQHLRPYCDGELGAVVCESIQMNEQGEAVRWRVRALR